MAGLYIHIPFCKKRCLYCDFFSTTLLERRQEYVDAVLREISERRDETGESIRTIYIGGGTPSTLPVNDIQRLLDAIGTSSAEEITVEVNPGDLSVDYLQTLRQTGVNRLSIGIQSFHDKLLTIIGRRHNAQQAIEAVRMAQEAGFCNISIDLIYALPTQTMDMWRSDIDTALQLNIQHISCYGLMYEDGTPLTALRDKGELTPVDEVTENAMYDYLCERLKENGFVHYEVSNFALQGYESKHNSSYWNGTPYIGIGAGAHSYLPPVRSWNPDDLDAYIRGIQTGSLQRESETLTDRDLYNESIMLGLRTCLGIDSEAIRGQFGVLEQYIQRHLLKKTPAGRIIATQQGIHILNRIIEELMI